ncbi:hypothetical protein NKH77_18760 [Streptomyces sp. M19]
MDNPGPPPPGPPVVDNSATPSSRPGPGRTHRYAPGPGRSPPHTPRQAAPAYAAKSRPRTPSSPDPVHRQPRPYTAKPRPSYTVRPRPPRPRTAP